jgi:hypothetical protein
MVGVRCELALKVALDDEAGHDVGDLELRVSRHAHTLLPQRARREPGRPARCERGCCTSDADEHVVSLVGLPPAEKFRRQIKAG